MANLPIWNGSSSMITFKSPSPIIVGVSCHSYGSASYPAYDSVTGVSLATQISLLQELGAMVCRTDWTSNMTQNTFISICQSMNAAGIKVLPVLGAYQQTMDSYTTEASSLQALYQLGYDRGVLCATNVDAYTYNHYYEIGNEYGNYSLAAGKGWTDGYYIADFDSAKIVKCFWYLKGMNDGIKSVVPTAKTIINSGYWCHFAFFRAMIDPSLIGISSTGINFDVVAVHPYWGNYVFYNHYSGMSVPDKNLANGYRALGKEIWFTECNAEGGSGTISEADQADKCDRWMRDLIFQAGDFVTGYICYELLNEPNLSAGSNQMGLVTVSGTGTAQDPYTVNYRKPAFYSTKNLFYWLKTTHTNT